MALSQKVYSTAFKSPLGWIRLEANEISLTLLNFVSEKPTRGPENEVLVKTKKQLEEYFSGKRKTFSVPLALEGSAFQKKVWSALYDIPFGELRSYAGLAAQIGHKKAFRAVGTALGKNKLPLLLPCHRVVNSGKGLGGFTGGLHLKTFLLKHEGSL